MLTDETTGRLPAQIIGNSKRIRDVLGALSGRVNAIRSLVEHPRVSTGTEVSAICGEAKMDIIGALAELNAIDASLAAAKMTGQIITALKATDLELHPVNGPDRTHELFARSLDRIGDDTLKEEGAR